jgi:acyl-coenzyme A synthetase/AMP-(fatty) acid ligase
MNARPADSDCLWCDPLSGARVTYGELREKVGRGELDWHPWLRPATAGEAVTAVLCALTSGCELTLVDADLSEEEAIAAGATPERLARRVRVPGRRFSSAAAMVAGLRAEFAADGGDRAGGFRLSLFTSGSSGLPKQVTHGLAGLGRMLRLGAHHADDVWGLAYNPAHIAGVQVVLQAFFNGNPLVQLFGHPPEVVAGALHSEGITHLSATPSFYRLLAGAGGALASGKVRSLSLGGERCDEALRARLASIFPSARIRNIYASTEAGTLFVAEGDEFTAPAGLSGKVRIEDGQLFLAADLLGDFSGGAELVRDGWYATGDTVEVTGSNPLRWRITGREREWVNVGGHKVNPAEVEAVLLAYPGVREARVFGRANSVLGQILVAELVAEPAPDEVEVRSHLAARLQAAKVPRLIKIVPSLERGRTGKMKRT